MAMVWYLTFGYLFETSSVVQILRFPISIKYPFSFNKSKEYGM